MPTPLMVNVKLASLAGTEIVNALAPGLNTMPLTSVSAERETLVILDVAKVAVSFGPLGTVIGPQSAAVPQSPPIGLNAQVALPAWLDSIVRIKRSAGRSQAMKGARMQGSFLPDRLAILISSAFIWAQLSWTIDDCREDTRAGTRI